MAKTFTDAEVRVTLADKTKAAIAKMKENFKKLGQTMNKDLGKGAVAGKEASKTLSAMNEKTEKGRQLMNAFGGSVGGAAGQILYFGGTIGSLVGKITPLEVAVMGGVAAVGLLGVALEKMSNVGLRTAIEQAEKLVKANEDLVKSTRDYINAEWDRLQNITTIAKKEAELRSKRQDLIDQLNRTERELAERIANLPKQYTVGTGIIGPIADAKKQIGLLNKQIVESTNEIDRLGEVEQAVATARYNAEVKAAELEEKRAKKKEERRAARQAGKARDPDAELFEAMVAARMMEQRNLDASLEMSKRRIELDQQEADARERIWRQMWDARDAMAWENAQRAERISQNAIKLDRKRRDQAVGLIEITGEIANAMAEGTKAQQIVAATAQAVISGFKMADEIAEGAGAIAAQNYAEAALHFAAATLHGVTIGKAIAAGASGGGGRSSVAARSAGRITGADEPTGARQTIVNVSGSIFSDGREWNRDLDLRTNRRFNLGARETTVG